MFAESTYYLWINILVILFPLLLSFDKKVHFYTSFRAVFISILIVGVPFIIWDVLFTKAGIWGFNPRYLIGIEWFGLPLEECLFFLTVPFACLFLFRVTQEYFPSIRNSSFKLPVYLFGIGAVGLLFLGYNKYYTLVNAIVFLLVFALALKTGKKIMSFFWISLIFSLLGFLLVNGVLTGTGIEEEIVWYNNAENLSIRLLTIPIEDFFYGTTLLLSNVLVFHKFGNNGE